MNRETPSGLDAQLDLLAREIRRWNQQTNLITRVDTDQQISRIMRQCRDGWALARQALAEEPWFAGSRHIDLGSGAGLPGLVWAALRQADGHPGESWLVEPREKRAWFLRRAIRAMGLLRAFVLAARWGDAALASERAGGPGVVVSLKALRLDDSQVIRGLAAAIPDFAAIHELAIIRFLDSEPRSLEELDDTFVDHLGDPETWWFPRGASVLGSGAPRLFLTRYRR
ncbi:MAG TPA: class I SAM-dependent methyltransferase [Candidatus Krumholzibacteria bacterium]|nr:class I SAM-dependent methyltransferase [Candidatus Krumholzibacteria bacterium]HPD73019.1 class I SAM-dependent methyltransferase [Candidatus Krumholzibacteria bacterium]HRY41818.1 class I SAM-dependent methyltransferase [Candidatus Krumholzibacteria bacterium]